MSKYIWYDDILYTDIGNDKLMIGTGIDTGKDDPNGVRNKETVPENLILPSSVYLKTVAVIGRNAFSSCSNIKSLFIPATIERIERYSLEYMNNLMNITIAPNSKIIFMQNVFNFVNCNLVIYFGGTKCQRENMIHDRIDRYIYSVIVSPSYKCKEFGNFKSTDNFTVDYSLKGLRNMLQTCKMQKTLMTSIAALNCIILGS